MSNSTKLCALLATVGTLGYLGYSLYVSKTDQLSVDSSVQTNNSDHVAPVIAERELDLHSIQKPSSTPQVVHVATEVESTTEQAILEPLSDLEQEALIDNSFDQEALAYVEEAVVPEEEPKVTAQTTQKLAPVGQKQLSKQEKVEKFSQHMADLQQQAATEWDNMSSEEREVAEEQVATFQENFQSEIERLSQMSPEDIEREKQEAMRRLEAENPEAYLAVKNMEDMFLELADATDE